MESFQWSLKPRVFEVHSSKLIKLNEDIKVWEKGFELEHRRLPNRDDILSRPFILELFENRHKEEEASILPSNSNFHIQKASNIIVKPTANGSTRPKPSYTQSVVQEADFFAEDSSFADYFGGFSTTPGPTAPSSDNTQQEPDETYDNPKNAEQSPEKEASPTRLPLFALMQYGRTTIPTVPSSVPVDEIPSQDAKESRKTETPSPPVQNDSNPASNHSEDIKSDEEQDDVVYYDENVTMTETDLTGYLGSTYSLESSMMDASGMNDWSDGVSIDGEETNGTDAGELPTFLSSRASLAQALNASRHLDIIEDDRARLSFDDDIINDDLPMESAAPTSNRSGPSKKRKRTDIMGVDDAVQSDEESDWKGGVPPKAATTRKKPKTETTTSEASNEATSVFASVPKSAKRQNYRKVDIKGSTKKMRMDRDTRELARARKNAMDLSRSLGPEVSPFEIIDESTLDVLLSDTISTAITTNVTADMSQEEADGQNTSVFRTEALAPLRRMLKQDKDLNSEQAQAVMLDILKKHWNMNAFKPGQREAIVRVLKGLPTLLLLPTGGGKSLCYQYPSMIAKNGITLVITPLLSLIDDQIRNLPRGLVGVSLNSKMSDSEINVALERLKNREAKILFLSPEKLASQTFKTMFRKLGIQINFVCVDEAHCISTWSHNFRPTYLSIFQHAVTDLGANCVLALTATATAATAASIMEQLKIHSDGLLKHHPIGENLDLKVVLAVDKYDKLEAFLKSPQLPSTGSVIVYVMFQRQADDLANYLIQKGLSAAAYHAGKTAIERKRVQSVFLSNRVRVLVATVAFGMGINHASVCSVVHFGMPKSVENYVQEIGRSGRDGSPAYCQILYHPSDIHLLKSLAHSDTQDRTTVKDLMVHIFGFKKPKAISGNPFKFGCLPISETEQKFDVKQSMISTILSLLANYGKIEILPQINSSCELSFHGDSIEKLKTRSKLMASCAELGKRIKGKFVVPMSVLAKKRKISIESIMNDLIEVCGRYQISHKFCDNSFYFKIIDPKDDWDLDPVIDKITARIKELEQVALSKIDDMFNLATTETHKSINEKIRDYFEKPIETAQFASSGLTTPSQAENTLPMSLRAPIPSITCSLPASTRALLVADVKVFLAHHGSEISTARQLARIFHGIPSPKFSKELWEMNKFWGKSISIPFEEICAIAQEQLIAALTANLM